MSMKADRFRMRSALSARAEAKTAFLSLTTVILSEAKDL